ncbi:hypothetical protein MTR_5g083830 [Medicago truncatula]|uniref:Uncharacterized protein n=1 Tax=Medicago truncatula TaxID=3880 RepID=G7K7C3_MEDTR|nr:hypothetical protein MTR_5g083830 [Medicago truncatula]
MPTLRDGGSIHVQGIRGVHGAVWMFSGVAVYRYYENHVIQPKPHVETPAPNLVQMEEWELLCPF